MSNYKYLHDAVTDGELKQALSDEQIYVPVDVTVLCCLRLNKFSKSVQFCICTLGIFIFYLVYGFFQELIFRLEGFKTYGMYLTLIQFVFYSAFSTTERHIKGDLQRRIPWKTYIILGLLTVGTMGLSNSSVGYLNYPTQVVFKCCKLIPVLVGGIIIQGKKHGLLDFVAAGCMSLGLTLFTLTDSQVSPNFNIKGVLLISSALVTDAVIGNVQEKNMKLHGASNMEVVFYSYSIGLVYIFIVLIVLGQLGPAFLFCAEHPMETYGYGFLFSLAGFCGVQLVLALIRTFGAFVAVTVTTCRKAVTIILSFIIFSKPFDYQYLWSGLIILLGIYLNFYNKQKHNWNFHQCNLFLLLGQVLGLNKKSQLIDLELNLV
ncbi:LOW QUALITY PROTEIN: adenosine 3'-phospho 5'-phosphosulfate transporter 2 [Tachypleus tridentatus]|uniref:LOW QUALITY PROTEIN: adenosine 3'-phospho 5'-phosphosulfate transporter 2 n=1 Tax=Tachypleus tridentatus TaxID=6853 RepID=UPI003FD637DB